MKNFRVVMSGLDVQPLLRQIGEHPELWNTNSARTSQFATVHYNVDDIILRYPGSGKENWNEVPFSVLTEAQDIVFALVGITRCELLGRVVISRLGPGQQIPPHDDHLPGGRPMFYQRYQVPLVSAEGVLFHCADETVHMAPGDIYWFANTRLHAVVNNSAEDRLSMIVDIRPFSPLGP
jgi:hypothetical protein